MAPIGLQINRGGANPNMWKTPNRLYLNRDRTAVVPGGSVEAASLLSPAGHQVTDADCKRYGLGPYATAEDATAAPTGVEEAEVDTDTETEEEGQQTDSQDGEPKDKVYDSTVHLPAKDTKPQRKK